MRYAARVVCFVFVGSQQHILCIPGCISSGFNSVSTRLPLTLGGK
jgi:hypothetical protein